jgi:hypothetical protein
MAVPHQDAYPVTFSDPFPLKGIGQPVYPDVEFLLGQFHVAVLDARFVRITFRPPCRPFSYVHRSVSLLVSEL